MDRMSLQNKKVVNKTINNRSLIQVPLLSWIGSDLDFPIQFRMKCEANFFKRG